MARYETGLGDEFEPGTEKVLSTYFAALSRGYVNDYGP